MNMFFVADVLSKERIRRIIIKTECSFNSDQIAPAEMKKVLPLALMFFCVLFNYTILRNTKVVIISLLYHLPMLPFFILAILCLCANHRTC